MKALKLFYLIAMDMTEKWTIPYDNWDKSYNNSAYISKKEWRNL